MKSQIINHLAKRSSVLRRIYLLIALLIASVLLVAVILVKHMQAQQTLYDEISRFHAPIIYYTEKLNSTLQDTKYNISLNKETSNETKVKYLLVDHIYLTQNHAHTIQSIAKSYPNLLTDNAQARLQQAINKLSNVFNDPSITNQDKLDLLPALIEATIFRVTQLNRLHVNLNDKNHHLLAQREKNNTTFLIQLTVIVFILACILAFPLLISIHRMVKSLQNAEQHQRKLREIAEIEHSRMWALLSAMNIGVLFEDKKSCVEFVNPAFHKIWEIEPNLTITGQRLDKLLEYFSPHVAYQKHSSEHLFHVADTLKASERIDIKLNNDHTLTQNSFPVIDSEENFLGRLWMYEDITHERQTTQQLLYLAEHDTLTGLNNRHQFQKNLAFQINTSQRTNHKFALLYFDLDDFKYINDTFGHNAGDHVLQRTAGKIGVLMRETETFARLGGDEFAFIATLEPNDDISTLPTRIINTITSIPFKFQDTTLRITASIGIAIYPDHGSNSEELIAHADSAMYQAKNLGKNTWSVYNPERKDSEKMVERMSWNRYISQALTQDLFALHFQGIYQTNTQKISHLEVLVRMQDPDDSAQLFMPGTFIPFAEKSAQIVDIDRWVLDKSIALLAQHPDLPPLAVNISGRSFDEPSLPLYIKDKIIHYGIDGSRLIIELTETEAVSDIHDAQHFIETIRQANCRICLDDFGSGFSTFTYLKYLDVEILKIDGIFIQDLPNNYENQIFVKAMVSISQGLGKSLVAEFVEDAETLQLLKEYGVQFSQGYHLDRPIKQSEMLKQHANKIKNIAL